MNDWNYTKKGGKLGLIYGLTYSLYLISGSFLTPLMITDVPGTGYEYNFLLDLILLLPLIPVVILPHPGIFILFEFPLAGAIAGAFFGFLIDLIKGSREDRTEKKQRETGVFIRIPLGSRKFVISEKAVNYLIITEFLILVFFVALSSASATTENSSSMNENQIDGVDGEYLKGGYSFGITIYFNKSTHLFNEYYPNGTTENGTYVTNETFLRLYYSEGKTAEYFINDSNLLSPTNRNQFSSEEEWINNCYMKPMLM
ncbi:hypothetical protein [Methanolacinia petrolearia]|uniref:hypothetical protein n=1 Tax=Methanolacinia petrolearia TaxID=54120 RepID=UPI003BAC248F